MKRSLLIILGIIIVLILVAVWVYVLLTGSPSNEEQFAEFGFGDTTDPTVVADPIPNTDNDAPTININQRDNLQQLTTKPVAGFAQVQHNASSTPAVYYVETGTGHIYSIDLQTGVEQRETGTTIPHTTNAVITPNGRHVLIQAGRGPTTEFIIGTIATNSQELGNFALNQSITSFSVSYDNQFLYTVTEGNNTVAKAYSPQENSSRTLFTVPFRETTVAWHHTAAGPHLVYPRAASRLEGYVYSFTDGVMRRMPIDGFGLSAVGSRKQVIYSNRTTDSYVSTGYDRSTGDTLALPITIIPEKCAFSPTDPDTAICGADLIDYNSQMPDQWYQGELTSRDRLWEITPEQGTAVLLADMPGLTGQTIDVTNPLFNTAGSAVYFQNKIDQTLWMYDLTI